MSPHDDHSWQLGDDQFHVVRHARRTKEFQPGEVLFEQGDKPKFAFLIRQGRVRVERKPATGKPIVLERGAGDLIGEFGCIDGAPRSATVIAATHVVAVVIPARELRRILLAEPLALFKLLAITIKRVRESDRLHLDFGTDRKDERVVRKLITLAEEAEEPGRTGKRSVRLDVTQAALADAAKVSRSTVARAYAMLRQRDLISTEHGLEVLDLERLRAFVTSEWS